MSQMKEDAVKISLGSNESYIEMDQVQGQKLQRKFSKIERDTIHAAMDQVKKTSENYKKSGLSPSTFMLGQLNVALIWWILGHNPESYWIFVMAKCYFYLALSWKIKCETYAEILYMVEFCWVTCHVYMIFLTFALLRVFGVQWEWLSFTSNKTAFYVFWGLANGPFAFSSIIFKNALVLHDLPNLASTFIHLTPCSLSWTLRWWGPQVMKAYPGVFTIPEPVWPIEESFWDIFVPPMAFYMIWWFIYFFIYMIPVGRYLGAPWHRLDTLYFWTMQTDKQQAKICGYDGSTPETRQRILPIFIYMLMHALLFVSTIAFSYVLYLNFWVHTVFVIYLFVLCTYYGSVRYFKMMTTYYEKGMQKIVRHQESAAPSTADASTNKGQKASIN